MENPYTHSGIVSMGVDIPVCLLRRLLRYDPETGYLFWEKRDVHLFKQCPDQKGACARWNGRLAGKRAFTSTDKDEYSVGSIFDKTHKAHRVIWAIVYGEWPVGQIDHINHDRSDNRLANLRLVSQFENNQNRPMSRRNKSGHVGVFWRDRDKVWVAKITVSGRSFYLGQFSRFEDAVAAREAANIKYGFHPNHGK